jgi:uncharacterized protein (TIGR03437 family)
MKIALLLLTAIFPIFATTPVWDNSGNGLLNGAYNFRQVLYISDGSGNINQEIAYFGGISFDGNGNYSLSGSNTLLDTGGTLGIPATGTYSIAASGYGFLSDPLLAGQSLYFLVSNHILIGSSTESPGADDSYNNDLFIAAPATPTFNTASFNGAYTVAGYLPGSGTLGTAADTTFQLNPNGAGSLGTVAITGYGGASAGMLTQSSASVPYGFSGGVGTISFPQNVTAALYEAPETFYLSPDKNFIFGGSPNGYDMFVGVRNAASGTPTLTTGLYYEIGLDDDESQMVSDGTANIDTYYGVLNAFQEANGYVSGTTSTVLGHERLLYAGSLAEGVAYTASYPTGTNTYPANVGQLDPSATVQYTIGAGGIRIGFGIGPWLGIEVAFPTAAPTPTGSAFIDPTGIVNTASSAPFTSGISPGEFITLYNGVNLANSSTCWTAGPPFPTTLAGVQVMFNGSIAAPIYCVGSQITVIVPYEVSASPIASIQVINGTVSSNIVTAYVYKTTPGVFTVPDGGLGFAAAQHGNYSLITTTNPALPGEEIVVYLSGLGSVFPVNGKSAVDGAATGPNGDNIISNIEVDVAGFGSTDIPYAGLTPSTAALYQINFQVPTTAPAGSDLLAIVGPSSYSAQALLPVGGTGTAARAAARRGLPRLSAGTGRP